MPLQSIPTDSPVILALPHAGTDMLPAIAERLADRTRLFTAPDRYIDRLVADVAPEMNYLRANFHRFQSDVEQEDAGKGGARSRGLQGVVPLLDQDGSLIWVAPPTPKEAESWRAMWYVPYHAALAAQIARVRARFGHVVLVTLHTHTASPRSKAGDVADIRLSSHMGASCALDLSARLGVVFRTWPDYTVSLEGRQGSGWSTRKYGRPRAGVHALDLAINDRTYLVSAAETVQYDPEKAEPLRQMLAAAFELLQGWRPA